MEIKNKIYEILDQHKQHSQIFREEVVKGLTKMEMQIKELSEHLKIANGRTGKMEHTVHELQKTDVLIVEQMKNIKNNGSVISDRMWTVITSVGSILLVSLIMWFLTLRR